MDRLRRWIQDWLQMTEGSWKPAMAESRARAMAMEARLTAIETALDDKGAELSTRPTTIASASRKRVKSDPSNCGF
jgi:hypothetical protein